MSQYICPAETGSGHDMDVRLFLRFMSSRSLQPFAGSDTSAGMEYELQVAVEGKLSDVDLPTVLEASTYYKNIVKRTARGDLPPSCLEALHDFLHHNSTKIWENSWIRFPEDRLTPWAKGILNKDFLADKRDCNSGPRGDAGRFRCLHQGEECLRLPISYLLKLALADAISRDATMPEALFNTGVGLLNHFLSDNTSPEILSFSIPTAARGRIGDLAAKESARTFLFCQLLVQYANSTFGLADSGQKCLLYCAPHAPSRQKQLNEIVPDGFYRHLFMSPCLSGWDRGEEKHQYMGLCHKTLSRSQLNTIGKLKDAGIITNNLVVLPNTSNTCLANNGIHVSLGSQLLTRLGREQISPFTPAVEKHVGDLVIKIVEHFLPLFVNTYSAAPYRLDFADFHPEKVLGFLPHEVDYTHLRMIWRRWKKKANMQFLGRTFTPFGPRWLDQALARLLCLRGDLVPDFRLIDYLVTLLSTETSPGLSGVPGNHERLKEELAEMGIFDPRMSIYLLYRQRHLSISGYAGFEGRCYSLFYSMLEDMSEAVDMQNLVTALAFRYILEGRISHRDIPDQPSVESERRQIFFGSAIGIPTFYVRADTENRLLRRILLKAPAHRDSRRYRGYVRVKQAEYKLALLEMIEADGADLIEQSGLQSRISSLRERLTGGRSSTFAKIIAGMGGELQGRKAPLQYPAAEFNAAMERFYRTGLREQHLREGLTVFIEDCKQLERQCDLNLREAAAALSSEMSPAEFVALHQESIVSETACPQTLLQLLRIGLALIHHERNTQYRDL